MNWYLTANRLADRLADGDIRMGAGVIAALSPNKRWSENMILAERALTSGVASGHVSNAVAKANWILAGADPSDVLRGDKVLSFYRLIADPVNNDHDVCLDRHAFDCAVGAPTDDRARKILERSSGYAYLADVYRHVAKGLDILPSATQAVAWVTWRNAKSDGRLWHVS